MKRIGTATMLIVAVAALAAAQPHAMGMMGDAWEDDYGPYAQEAQEILTDYEDRVPAELTFGEIGELAGLLSIPAQKAAWVAKSEFASLVMPGAGQFMNDDAVSGALFTIGSLAVTSGTLVGVYFLLPDDVQFGQIDYFNDPNSEIKAAWEGAIAGMSLRDALPIMGVLTGGAILDAILSGFSARHAGDLAQQRIEAGAITFEARPEIIIGPAGMALNMRMRY